MSNDLRKIAVGIDVGSVNARVAVISGSASTAHASAKVVSNTLGHRSTPAIVVKEEDHIVVGEAAHRLLIKQKKSLEQHTVHYLTNNTNEGTNTLLANDLVSSYMGHLASLASDATSVQPSQLRVTLSVPVDAREEFVESLVERTTQGVKKLMKQSSSKNGKNKKIKDGIVVGVMTDAAAVCVAHGITDKKTEEKDEEETNNKRVLVVDWGGSGLTLTNFELMGSSRILTVKSTTREESLGGHVLVEVFAKHVATQFERKNKIPSGEVWQNYKSRMKLLSACEASLQSMTSSISGGGGSGNSTVHVTIDGLFEGIDCHVGVSRPRWDMLTSSYLAKAQTLLEGVSDKPNVVLVAGSVSLMSSVQQLMDKIFENVNRGLPNISADEAIAMGCSRHAAHAADLMNADRTVPIVPVISHISVSPIELALKSHESDDVITLIRKGTPLPAHVTHTFKCDAGQSYGLWQQIPVNKLVALLEDLPSNEEKVELLVELSTTGSLSLAVQGGEVVSL